MKYVFRFSGAHVTDCQNNFFQHTLCYFHIPHKKMKQKQTLSSFRFKFRFKVSVSVFRKTWDLYLFLAHSFYWDKNTEISNTKMGQSCITCWFILPSLSLSTANAWPCPHKHFEAKMGLPSYSLFWGQFAKQHLEFFHLACKEYGQASSMSSLGE